MLWGECILQAMLFSIPLKNSIFKMLIQRISCSFCLIKILNMSTVNAVKFCGIFLAFVQLQKHIRGLLNSRLADT